MKKVFAVLLIFLLVQTVFAQEQPRLTIVDGTPIRLRTTENLSSHDAVAGSSVAFEVMEDIYVDDILVIKKGATAIGTITDAHKKRSMGRQGKLDMTIDYVRLVNGEKAQLRGTKIGNGGGHTGAMVGAMVATSLVVWPAAPLFLLMHGKDINIAKGTPITAFIDGDFNVDVTKNRRAIQQVQPAVEQAPATQAPPAAIPVATQAAPAPPLATQAPAKPCSNVWMTSSGSEVCMDSK